MSVASLRRLKRPLLLGSFIAWVAYALHTLLPDNDGMAAFFDTYVYFVLMFAAVLLCALRVLVVAEDRAAWTLLCVGVSAYALADLYWQIELSTLEEPAFPSLADVGYLAYFPPVYAGLILLLRKRIRATRAIWLDGATAALAAASVAAAAIVQVVLDSTGGSVAAVVTNLAYPAGDILLLAMLLGALAVGGRSMGRPMLLLIGAVALGAVADSIYLFQAARVTYEAGTYLDALWPASMLCIGYAAWSDVSSRDRRPAHARPLLFVPMACGTAAIGVLVSQAWFSISPIAVVLAAAALGGVLVRLVLTFGENRRLLELTHGEATTDQLTGLSNRRKLIRDLDYACGTFGEGRVWLLALFDLDGFKRYNDTFGHPAGDALLERLGTKLAAAVGSDGTAYRLGGDEFCLLTDAPLPDAAAMLERSVQALSERGEAFAVSTSFGAVFLPEDADNPSETLKSADQRLYAQKSQRQTRRDRTDEVLVRALYEREPSLEEHVHRVVGLSVAVAEALGMSPDQLQLVERAALLHDVGKLAIPEDILRKPGRLTDEELAFVRRHTIVGERILAASPAMRTAGAIVRATHERWDGAGYPDGIAGEAIPLEARVIAACNAFVALQERRSYRPVMARDAALARMRSSRGEQFDPRVVDELIHVAGVDEGDGAKQTDQSQLSACERDQRS